MYYYLQALEKSKGFTSPGFKILQPQDVRIFFFLLLFRRACLTLLDSSHPPCACPRSPEKHLELHLFCRLCTVAFIVYNLKDYSRFFLKFFEQLFVCFFCFQIVTVQKV